MPVSFNLFLSSRALYHEAVGVLTGQAPPEGLPAQMSLGEGLSLTCVEGLDGLPDPGSGAYMARRYDAILAAADAGWRTVWYNPRGAIAPVENPVHDADLLDLGHLPEIGLSLERKPRQAQCLAWWDVWEVPENIRAHSRTVGRSAYHLAVLLRNRGIPVDPILAQRGGLLHDIDKIETLEQSGAHGRKGADFLAEEGYPELAEIVREHIMSTILHPHADGRPWEVKLVYFADKLVEADRLVPFDQRLTALLERYPHYGETMQRAAGPVMALSDEICSILNIAGHAQLVERLKALMRH